MTEQLLDETPPRLPENEDDKEFVKIFVDWMLYLANQFMAEGDSLRPYQTEFVRRVFESMVKDDGDTITGCFSRQSGKSESLAVITCVAMVFFPMFAKQYPKHLYKFRNGVLVGAFAPVDEQADNLFGRIKDRLTSESAQTVLTDPDIDLQWDVKSRYIKLSNKSEVRKTTCHPKATIEGRTYHLILIDEAQGADTIVVDKKIFPMGAATHPTKVMTGTPSYQKSIFYDTIVRNKSEDSGRRKKNHYEYNWRTVVKHNPFYQKTINDEMQRLGEDNDEFKLSYSCIWLLEKGMFTTSERLEALGDKSMQSFVTEYRKTPVVVGIDVGRKQDKTIVTVVYVDWDNPDQFGVRYHQILNWLDLGGENWEEQYFQIREFLSNYNIYKVGIDVGGLGDVVAQRLKVLMPRTEIVELGSAQVDQSVRWKFLNDLMEKGQISWPAGAKLRQRTKYRRFIEEMRNLELNYKGPYMLAEAPKIANAHDDYPDSLAMACILSRMENDEESGQVEISSNVLYSKGINSRGGYLHSLR